MLFVFVSIMIESGVVGYRHCTFCDYKRGFSHGPDPVDVIVSVQPVCIYSLHSSSISDLFLIFNTQSGPICPAYIQLLCGVQC